MNALIINNGPFKGETFDATDGYQTTMEDGQVRTTIAMARLTQRFLERFPPAEGWSVAITGEFLPMDMVPLPRNGQVGDMQHVPSAKFVATLFNCNRLIGQASTLWAIQGPTDWERGETNARQRLYEAMGLQTRFGEPMSEQVPRARTGGIASVSTIHAAPAKPVTVSPVNEEPVSRSTPEEPTPAAESPKDQAPEPASNRPRSRGKGRQESSAAPAATGSEPATSPSGENPSAPNQGAMELGETDPQMLPPPEAMLAQIKRLAQLMQKEVPELATRAQATAFLAGLQGR